jgi:hypothetical protein
MSTPPPASKRRNVSTPPRARIHSAGVMASGTQWSRHASPTAMTISTTAPITGPASVMPRFAGTDEIVPA